MCNLGARPIEEDRLGGGRQYDPRDLLALLRRRFFQRHAFLLQYLKTWPSSVR